MPSFHLAALFGGAVAVATQISSFVDPDVPQRTASVPAETAISSTAPISSTVVDPANASAFERVLTQIDFDLDKIRVGSEAVPAMYLASLPQDLGTIDQVDRKKQLFFSAVLPLALGANERVLRERTRLVLLRDRVLVGTGLRQVEQNWLLELADRYGVETDGANIDAATLDSLFRRVDIVPVSLTLAQAAVESGWGSSRFARNGNALFGQRAWSDDAGIVPKERESNEAHVVRSYGDLMSSVRSYVHNLNTHPSYGDFRANRAKMRAGGQLPDGKSLAGDLLAYAETGAHYVKTLRLVIKKNRLGDFDRADLQRNIVTASN